MGEDCFMKKLLAVTLVVLLLAGCGAVTTKTGIGNVVSVAKSVSATAEKAGLAQVDTVMAAVTFDSNNKILDVKIDNAQTKINFDNTGKITTTLTDAKVVKTKVELGDAYGMKAQSKIGKEWFEQIAALEDWMVGKTVDEVKAMKVKKVDDAHPNVPDVEELKTKVTITVQDYIACVEEALQNANKGATK
jgi:uncharacterized protein YcfL